MNILSRKIRRIIELFTNILFLIFTVTVTYQSVRLVLMSYRLEDVASMTGIPMYLIASEVNETEIPDEVFDVPDDFEDVPREELEKIFTSLI